jgi:hypothetical protein
MQPFNRKMLGSGLASLGRLGRRRPLAGRRLARPGEMVNTARTPEQRLLVLDAWRRSGLAAGDFALLFGISKHTVHARKHKFDLEGPAGLLDHPRGSPTGGRLPSSRAGPSSCSRNPTPTGAASALPPDVTVARRCRLAPSLWLASWARGITSWRRSPPGRTPVTRAPFGVPAPNPSMRQPVPLARRRAVCGR